MTDREREISREELTNVLGGTSAGTRVTCPRCQCPQLTWAGRKYTCNECGYQGYA